MFLHAENKQILWRTIQKSPYFVEFAQKYTTTVHREKWFVDSCDRFYCRLGADSGGESSAKSLLDLNKKAILFMIADLKRLLGVKTEEPVFHRHQPEDNGNLYDSYKEEYNRLLASPAKPDMKFSVEVDDGKITNMDELIAEQIKRRALDYAECLPSQPKPPSKEERRPERLKIMEEINNVEKTVHWNDEAVSYS
jgi:hypothetical protein